jgi:hypothetical protein
MRGETMLSNGQCGSGQLMLSHPLSGHAHSLGSADFWTEATTVFWPSKERGILGEIRLETCRLRRAFV